MYCHVVDRGDLGRMKVSNQSTRRNAKTAKTAKPFAFDSCYNISHVERGQTRGLLNNRSGAEAILAGLASPHPRLDPAERCTNRRRRFIHVGAISCLF